MHSRRSPKAIARGAASALFWIALSWITLAACSGTRAEFDGPATPPELADPDAGSPDAASCGSSCSRDLKKVLKGCPGSEVVVAECGPDEGCGDGACVDACRSAELSKGSAGCSFWTLPPDEEEYNAGACFAAMIANTWDRPVTISAAFGGAPIDIAKSIYLPESHGESTSYTLLAGPVPPGKVAIVFLAQAPDTDAPGACPAEVTPAIHEDPIRHGTAITRAFHLRADAPVSAYSIYPYGGARTYLPSATLLLPTSSWEKDYIAVSTATLSEGTGIGWTGGRTLQVVAEEDATEVQMRPNADLIGGPGVAGSPAGQAQTWRLDRGQVLQIQQSANLSGSPISANKPIGIFGGSECTNIPNAFRACDTTQQQIAPFAHWGREYALVPYRPRIVASSPDVREIVPWSFVGAVDGTVLEYEPARPRGAPETLSAGQMVTFMTDDLLVVRSQGATHPFHAAVYMTGYGFLDGATRMGDPEFVIVPPTDQFLDRYVFFVDYTYPESNITLVRRKTANGFHPVSLDCAGEVTTFRPLGTSGEYEYTWLTLTTGSVPQKYPGGTCGYGRHEAQSDGPFAVTVWGIGEAASYGYVGGIGSRPINVAKPPRVQ